MRKMGYCEMCLFDKHETIGCAAQQLRWALEDLVLGFPGMDKIIKDHSYCKHFEQLEGWYD